MSKLVSIPNFECLYKNKSGSYFYNTQLKSRKPSGEFRRRLIKLKGASIDSAIKDIRSRKLYLKFNNLTKKKATAKIRLLENNLKEINHLKRCINKLNSNLEMFAWRGFKDIKFVVNRDIYSLVFEEGKIIFNPSWVSINTDIDIIRKLRTFVKNNTL